MSDVSLREVRADDLGVFFEQQCDAQARWMVAFGPQEPRDRASSDAHWAKILSDKQVLARAVVCDGLVVGHVVSFVRDGPREVGYWIGRQHWGQGIATRALEQLLALIPERPLYARAAQDNHASVRVLEKCGFHVLLHERGFSHAREAEIDEVVLELAAAPPGGVVG